MNVRYEELPTTKKLGAELLYDDLFICALGFEDRCPTTAERLKELGYRCEKSVMLRFDVSQENNDKNYPKLKGILTEITRSGTYEPTYVPSDLSDTYVSEKDARRTLERLLGANGADRVSVDISSFSTPMLFEVLDLLFKSNLRRLRILYTEGKDYPPAKSEGEYEFLSEEYISTGLKTIITPPAFKGIFTPGYSPLYVAFLSNEPMRARSMLDIYQPSRKIVVLVTPGKPEDRWKLDLQKKMYRFSVTQQDTLVDLPNDYIEAYKYLEGVYNQFCQVNNINVIPLGSKMHTLAIWLFLERHSDVRLLISIPMNYDPSRYSRGIGETYQMIFHVTRSISDEKSSPGETSVRAAA